MIFPDMKGLPLHRVIVRTVTEFMDDEMSTYASALAYQMLFSLFPFILFLIALIGFLHLPDFFSWLRLQSELVLPPQALEQVGLGLVLSVGSSVLNGLLAWVMFRAAREHRSLALEADARHLVTDVWTSVGVVVGIVLVGVTGWLWLDAVVAMGVALNILKEGVHLVWSSSQGLMDEAVEPEVKQDIQQVLGRFVYDIDGRDVIRFDHVVTRKAGQRRFVDMHMHMPANWSLGHAASLRNQVERALMSAVPGLRATIQLLPSDVEAHFDDPKDPT